MKLTPEDKEFIVECGETEDSFWQIEEALKATKTKYKLEGKPISREKAMNLLGRKVFLTGIIRSAFHYTAARETENGKTVLFDSSRLFK